MQILGFVISIVVFLVTLLFALVVNMVDEERAAYYRERRQVRTDLWQFTVYSSILVLVGPLVPLFLMTDVFEDKSLLKAGPALAWFAVVVVSFIATRHFIFRPLMVRLDERDAKK